MNLKREFESMTRNNLLRNYEIDLEFSKLSKPKRSNLEISQSDLNSNIIRLNLLMNNNPITLEEHYVVYANIKKPTGEVNPNYCEIYDKVNGSILLKILPQYVDLDGACSFEIIVVTGDGVKVVSPEVNFIVTQSLDYFLGEPDLEDISNLDFLVKTVSNLKNDVLITNSNIEENENIRQKTENSREIAENERKSAEDSRKEIFETIKNNFEEIKTTFNNKVVETNNTIENCNSELENIKIEHQERVNMFDNEIITFFNNSKTAEENRVLSENQRKDDEQNRKLSEEKRIDQEKQRQINENERINSFNSITASELTRESNENKREQKEEERVNSLLSMQNTFNQKVQVVDNKISQISSKIIEADTKINKFTNDEEIRQQQHKQRITEFDNEIKSSFSEMILSEETRVSQENIRISSENERKSFYTQVKIDENTRNIADLQREERVKNLETRVDEKINTTDTHVTSLESRVTAKINEYNTATLITNAEIDTIIANALK